MTKEFNIIREKLSSRGGGIEIALDNFGYEGEKMTAYQNYLGGGMLGSIGSDCTMSCWSEDSKLLEVSEELKRHFHNLTNHEDDEWASATFDEIQARPSRGY
tara:strand:- start:28 stop:333 length:306 start_codon:yes stop_codon:yes gene_type:complete